MRKPGARVLAFLLCLCMIVPQQTGVAAGAEINNKISLAYGEPDVSGEPDISGDSVIFGEPEPDVSGMPDVSGEMDPIDEPVAEPDGTAPDSAAHGSGSYQLNEEPTHYRFYTEYFVKADTGKNIKSAGIDRRTSIKVYAKAGEYILFGSSVANSQIDENNQYIKSVTGKDIVITKPDGSKTWKDVLLPNEVDEEGHVRPNGLGYIKNPTQEKNGPMVNYTDETNPDEYYVPLQYEVTETGVYTFEFHSVTGFNPKNAGANDLPKPRKAGEEWFQGNTSVAAWDVTILGKKTESEWEVKSGRAWADYLALTTADGNQTESDLDVHILSHDGYQYKVKFNKAVPFGFIFFANNTGFMSAVTDESSNTTYRPIYHSFYDSSNDLDYIANENIYLHKPNEADTDTEETYKIFFNAPNSDLNGVTYSKNGSEETIKTSPGDPVEISDLKFFGIQNNVARTGHGGYFTFHSNGEAMVTIRLDLRKAIFESEGTMDAYEGSGIVEITAPAVKTEGDEVNRIYWNGKDTDGITLPAGIYGDNNVVLSTEVKRGELHFPVIDMEGLHGGLTVRRINGDDLDSDDCYNIYYNNNPLAYGNIEGKDYAAVPDGSSYYKMSDGTRSYKIASDKGPIYFKNYPAKDISTLVKDDKEYLAHKLFDTDYDSLTPERKAIIDAEFGKEQDTFHLEPVDSRNVTMKFDCSGFIGGGNQAGIDAWTYYTQGIDSQMISFALMDTDARGLVSGQIFYDANISSTDDAATSPVGDYKDYPLSGIKVRLIDKDGEPLVHEENLPCFDETGHFIYDKDGKVKHEKKIVNFETETDSSGTYRFTGVPYSLTEDTRYYVQVLLSDVQSEVMRYTCTTSDVVRTQLVTDDGDYFLTVPSIDTDLYGADGNKIEPTDESTKIYRHKYARNDKAETVFDIENAQSVTFSSTYDGDEIIREEKFKKIGFSSTVPPANQMDYMLVKNWGTDSEGNPTHQISDGLTVELWVWNDEYVQEENKNELSRRTGALLDTQVLSANNEWKYTWKNMDDRLQYYVLEYYTKKNANGEIIYNDKHEARMVLIGGTMPLFSTVPTDYESGIYGFDVNLGDYPETFVYTDGSIRIPIQKFDENNGITHANSITKREKLESVENNARQYDVTYTLSSTVIDGRNTNVINLTNSQVFDDRTYYVWLDHQTELPDLIAQTYVTDGERQSHAVLLEKDTNLPLDNGGYCIKGLSVSSVDAAKTENFEGNATGAFFVTEDGQSNALFIPTNKGNYKTGTGTRTYQVKYVVNSATKAPVSVKTDENDALVLYDNPTVKVEESDGYIVYSWFMTIHVYNVKSDGVFEYDPDDGTVVLQKALKVGQELSWTLTHDGTNYNSIEYTSNDNRKTGILMNDTYRLPLYKAAENPDMGSCADLVGIAYAGSAPVADVSTLVFEDTYSSRYYGSSDNGKKDGQAKVKGKGGTLTVKLSTPRGTRINRTQDHANYADVTFAPKKVNVASTTNDSGIVKTTQSASSKDVFYYKVVVLAEDSTYHYVQYDDIDATDGVVMYAYFTMKPKTDTSTNGEDDGNGTQWPDQTPKSDVPDGKIGATPPKTGDDNNPVLWLGLFVLAVIMVTVGIRKRKSCYNSEK